MENTLKVDSEKKEGGETELSGEKIAGIKRKQYEEPVWELYYWPGMAGRGEYARIMFEEAGVKYKEMNEVEGKDTIISFVWGGKNKDFPVLAPPVIKRGNFTLCQVHAIMAHLGKLYKMYPEGLEDEAHAEQVSLCLIDFIAEGRLSFHHKNHRESYFNQIEETKPYIDEWAKERLPWFLKFFEKVLKHNKEKNPGSDFVVGKKLTYVDLHLFVALSVSKFQFPERYKELESDFPLCEAFRKKIYERPNIKAYYESDRRVPFEGNSMM